MGPRKKESVVFLKIQTWHFSRWCPKKGVCEALAQSRGLCRKGLLIAANINTKEGWSSL